MEMCKRAGMGLSGLITKCDQAIIAVKYIQFEWTEAMDTAHLAEIYNTVSRVSAWRGGYGNEKMVVEAP